MWWRWRVHDWLFVFVLFSRKTTSAYQRAARWTWGSLERKRMSTQRWLKRRWTLTTVSQIVSTHTDTHTIKDKRPNLKDDFDWLLLCICCVPEMDWQHVHGCLPVGKVILQRITSLISPSTDFFCPCQPLFIIFKLQQLRCQKRLNLLKEFLYLINPLGSKSS